ncbi:hypothetical protein [Prevotella sp. HUN102]|uniref:hypothetical protein n=1 Tax=Prevotella sp. HUN102 TaxID=1392486 RepID=UPI000A5C60D8|nr:hypothetical protein [Prevotella sp. HUN102]
MEKLKIEELENIFGGVSREEYCELLLKILKDNQLSGKALEGWSIGFKTHCIDL